MQTLFNLLSAYPFAASCIPTAIGLFLIWRSSKQRNAEGEWSDSLQWGYLLTVVGLFAVMAFGFGWTLTAVLLTFTAATGAAWSWAKLAKRGSENKNSPDNNHFRDYMSGLFPMLAVIFLVRTFIVEPYQIPSSSMRPGLVVGDFVLVNKFGYGIRMPLTNRVVIPVGGINRGDVVVFQYPLAEHQSYVKRIVAVPGDTIVYRNKILTVNNQSEHQTAAGSYRYPDDKNPQISRENSQLRVISAGRQFTILQDGDSPAVSAAAWNAFKAEMTALGIDSGLAEHCRFEADGSGFACTVPAGKYFAMGDNRDNSADSRYWGFVDDRLITGKAFAVLTNFRDFSRSFSSIE